MGKIRVRHCVEFKAKVALEALKGLKTVNELARQYQLHTRCRSAKGSGRCKEERKTCLLGGRGRTTKRSKPCKRTCTKKSVA